MLVLSSSAINPCPTPLGTDTTRRLFVSRRIEHHFPNVGDPTLNLKLSNERAKRVYDILLMEGISSNRLIWKGFGMTKPKASNLTEKGKAMNRRTEFVITEK